MVALVMLASFWVITKVAIWVRVGLLYIGPTNWLDAYLHTRRGMKWGPVCWPLAGLSVLGMRFIEASAPTAGPAIWQVFLWGLLWFDALKLVRMGIVSVALLIRARFREARAARWARREREYERAGVIGAPGDPEASRRPPMDPARDALALAARDLLADLAASAPTPRRLDEATQRLDRSIAEHMPMGPLGRVPSARRAAATPASRRSR